MNQWSDSLWSLLWTQIWQMTAVIIVGFVAVSLCSRSRPHLAHTILLLVVIKCVTRLRLHYGGSTRPFGGYLANSRENGNDAAMTKFGRPCGANLNNMHRLYSTF